MARTNPIAVQGIIGLDPAIDVKPFIKTANVIVNKIAANDEDSELPSDHLAEIEVYLAAHFYSHRDQLLQSKSEGRASGSFQGQTAMHFNSTQYGQTAMMLDVTGYLANLQQQAEKGVGVPLQLLWLGTEAET